MKLKTKILELETGGKPIVIVNKEDAEELGIRSLSRLVIKKGEKKLTGIANITTKIVGRGKIGVNESIARVLNLADKEEVEIEVAKFPSSLQHIKNKLKERKLSYKEIFEIVKDVVEGNLSEGEIASFVVALEAKGLDLDEAASLSLAMVETGKKLGLKKKIIVDKHSIGGIAGDKTTLLVVPIIAASGLAIPKTSSRAITGAAGTADRAECLMPVSLSIEEMKKVVEKTNGCIAWGGALHLAPADDMFIQAEYPLTIDPMLLPSIMAKKKAVGAKFLVVDIPTGRGAKMKTIGDANLLAKDFIELGERLGIKTQCAITDGEQPLGYAVGPALEAREALEVLMGKNVQDLVDKAAHLAGILFEMVGKRDGYKLALEILNSGKAEKKMREIIAAQGGNKKIRPEEIQIGQNKLDIIAEKSGIVLWLNNVGINEVARAAGSPKDKGAGLLLYKKLNDKVFKGEKLLTIFAEKSRKLERAKEVFEENGIIGVGDRREMLIQQVKEIPIHKKTFILER
ncbi:MAG: AMP phosphorylase [Candidatus Aenigmatarchaeota archaeon]